MRFLIEQTVAVAFTQMGIRDPSWWVVRVTVPTRRWVVMITVPAQPAAHCASESFGLALDHGHRIGEVNVVNVNSGWSGQS